MSDDNKKAKTEKQLKDESDNQIQYLSAKIKNLKGSKKRFDVATRKQLGQELGIILNAKNKLFGIKRAVPVYRPHLNKMNPVGHADLIGEAVK